MVLFCFDLPPTMIIKKKDMYMFFVERKGASRKIVIFRWFKYFSPCLLQSLFLSISLSLPSSLSISLFSYTSLVSSSVTTHKDNGRQTRHLRAGGDAAGERTGKMIEGGGQRSEREREGAPMIDKQSILRAYSRRYYEDVTRRRTRDADSNFIVVVVVVF